MKSPFVFVTIITQNYLSYARTLVRSVRQFHPESTAYVLLADKFNGLWKPEKEDFKTIFLEDLADQEILHQMAFYYNAQEFCCAVRPWLHAYLADQKKLDRWIFLDSDMMVLSPLHELLDLFKKGDALVTPHLLEMLSGENSKRFEFGALRTGLYNAGFLGLKNTPDVRAFIEWWKQKLRFYCFRRAGQGQFLDQFWVNFIPIYVPSTHIVRIKGANVAFWNAHERNLRIDAEGKLLAGDKPVLFYHFSGWKIALPEQVSEYAEPQFVRELQEKIWPSLASRYRDQLVANGYQETINFDYAFQRFPNGQLVDRLMKHQCYRRLAEGTYKGDPFLDYEYFTQWLNFQKQKNTVSYKLKKRIKSSVSYRLGLLKRLLGLSS